MDIEDHPKRAGKVLVTIENSTEEDTIANAFIGVFGLPSTKFAFKRVVVDAWTGRRSQFPYTTTLPEKNLGPIAIEAFSHVGNPQESMIRQHMGEAVIGYLQSFQSESLTLAETPSQT